MAGRPCLRRLKQHPCRRPSTTRFQDGLISTSAQISTNPFPSSIAIRSPNSRWQLVAQDSDPAVSQENPRAVACRPGVRVRARLVFCMATCVWYVAYHAGCDLGPRRLYLLHGPDTGGHTRRTGTRRKKRNVGSLRTVEFYSQLVVAFRHGEMKSDGLSDIFCRGSLNSFPPLISS